MADRVAVDATRLWKDVEAIAQWPREAGSAGEAAAFDYIAHRLEQHGITTVRQGTPALISLPVRAELTVEGRAFQAITHAMGATTGTEGIEAPLVSARVVEERDWHARIVVFDGRATSSTVLRAQRAGAHAALFLSFDCIAHEMIVSDVWGSPELDELARLPHIPVVTVGGPEAAALREMLAAPATTPVGQLAADVKTGWCDIPLLVAEIRAPRAHDEQFVLLSGHVDSWHLGAMDNAGANAVMLELARIAHGQRAKLWRHLRVAFWSGHSQGRYAGSAWYADEHWEELDRDCVMHLNIDSVGARGASVLAHAPSMPDTYDIGAQAVHAVTGQELDRHRFPRAGDQSFVNIGISSLFLTLSEQPPDGESRLRDGSGLLHGDEGAPTGGLGWWWHTPEDTRDKLSPEVLARDAEVYVHAIDAFTSDPIVPLDIAASAVELDERLRAIALRCGDRVDLAPVLEASRQVAALAAEAMQLAARLRGQPEARAVGPLNRALVAAGRPLTRISYAKVDRFRHDSAGTLPAVPLLAPVGALCTAAPASQDYHALRITAVRGRNRVLHELRLAAEALERALADR